MSAGDQAVAAIIARLALAADGAVLGVALGYVAAKTFIKFTTASSALRRISAAPSVQVSDLRSLLDDSGDGGDIGGRLVVVRGTVEAKSAVNGCWKSLWPDVLVSHDSGIKGVIIHRSQKCIYNQWRGFFGWYPNVRTVLAKAWRDQGSTSTRTVPFVLVQDSQQPQSDYVVIDLNESKHPLPLATVYHKMTPIHASPYTFLQAIFGHEYPVGILDEEKILQLGKDVTAVGICHSRNGIPEIKSCKDLPYFLSDMTKDQMVNELSFKANLLAWSGLIVGCVSVCILGYAMGRNWTRWKIRREQRRALQRFAAASTAAAAADDASSEPEPEVIEEDEVGNVPDGQLCVICLTRRRQSAFVPCGHLVCCLRCALNVGRDLAPKCPVCRQTISGSVRIYDS